MNYHNVHPAKVVFTRLLGAHGAARCCAGSPSSAGGCRASTNAVRGNKSFTADLYPLGLARAVRHLRTTQQFFDDAAAGTLPAVSIVDPDFGLYSEENPQDISLGETFSAAVVNAVMHGTAWESTLLLWIYDEHGGYYDHVPPPAAVAAGRRAGAQLAAVAAEVAALPRSRRRPSRSWQNADDGPVTYDRYGFRVPAVIVSPYARPGLRAAAMCSTTPRCSS